MVRITPNYRLNWSPFWSEESWVFVCIMRKALHIWARGTCHSSLQILWNSSERSMCSHLGLRFSEDVQLGSSQIPRWVVQAIPFPLHSTPALSVLYARCLLFWWEHSPLQHKLCECWVLRSSCPVPVTARHSQVCCCHYHVYWWTGIRFWTRDEHWGVPSSTHDASN